MQHRLFYTEPESIYSFPNYDDFNLPAQHCSPLPMEPVPLDLAGFFDQPNDYFPEDSIQYAPSLWSSECPQAMRLVSSSPLFDSDVPSTRSSSSSPAPTPAYRFRDHATESLDNLFCFDFQGSTLAAPYPSASASEHCLDPLSVLPPADSPYEFATTLSSGGSPPPPPISGISSTHRRTQSLDSSPSTSDCGQQYHQKRRFPCEMPGCVRRFTSQYTLKVHMQAHRPKPKVSFPCTEGCSERFSRQHDRLRHEVAKHGKICEFLCDDCGRFFSTRKTLGNHKCPVAQGGTRWVTN